MICDTDSLKSLILMYCLREDYFKFLPVSRGSKNFPEPKYYVNILGARRVTWSKFHTQSPEIFCASVQNLVTCSNVCSLCV